MQSNRFSILTSSPISQRTKVVKNHFDQKYFYIDPSSSHSSSFSELWHECIALVITHRQYVVIYIQQLHKKQAGVLSFEYYFLWINKDVFASVRDTCNLIFILTEIQTRTLFRVKDFVDFWRILFDKFGNFPEIWKFWKFLKSETEKKRLVIGTHRTRSAFSGPPRGASMNVTSKGY